MHFRIMITLLIAIFISFASSDVIPEEKAEGSVKAARIRALRWLKNQKVPGRVLSVPHPERRNLVVSYEINPKEPAYKYISGRSIIYDDALAVIAFTMNRDYRNASQVLTAMKRLLRRDGGLWFGYNVNNTWPSEQDHGGATERSGATAWVGYSACFYLMIRIADNPSYIQKKREGRAILSLAVSLGDYLLKMQVKNKNDIRYGLITGGRNSYSLKMKDNNVSEIFTETVIDWISTEHNIDAYFFLKELAVLTKKRVYEKSAADIRENLLRVWSKKDGQYYRGIKPTYIDKALALDCATWGAVFSLTAGKPKYAVRSLEVIEKLYTGSAPAFKGGSTVHGYKPYADKEIYEETDRQVTKHYFPNLGGTTWDRISGVWVEGSMGAALAYLKNGNRQKASEILANILPLQTESGGFIYFTRKIPHEFSTYASVASTAWFIMIATALENRTMADAFWR